MAPSLDYVAPMVYPSHWGTDEYGLKDPNANPYEIVNRSLKDFQKDVKGTSAQVVPWLQAFTLGKPSYGPAEVRAQEKGAKDDGIDGFLLWNAGANYVADALPTMRLSRTGESRGVRVAPPGRTTKSPLRRSDDHRDGERLRGDQ